MQKLASAGCSHDSRGMDATVEGVCLSWPVVQNPYTLLECKRGEMANGKPLRTMSVRLLSLGVHHFSKKI